VFGLAPRTAHTRITHYTEVNTKPKTNRTLDVAAAAALGKHLHHVDAGGAPFGDAVGVRRRGWRFCGFGFGLGGGGVGLVLVLVSDAAFFAV
jgi:hypothetical protein